MPSHVFLEWLYYGLRIDGMFFKLVIDRLSLIDFTNGTETDFKDTYILIHLYLMVGSQNFLDVDKVAKI